VKILYLTYGENVSCTEVQLKNAVENPEGGCSIIWMIQESM